MKRGNPEPILIVKRTEWRKFIDYFGLSIEVDPSKMVKNNTHLVRIGSIPDTSYGNPHIERQHMDKDLIWDHKSYGCIK